MELIYAIAEYLEVPNEYIKIDSVIDGLAFFHDTRSPLVKYSCKTIRSGKYLKKNSIRRDF